MPELGKQIQHDSAPRGSYIFTNLDEVDSIVAELESLRQDLVLDSRDLREAIGAARYPADDVMSKAQVQAYRNSLRKAFEHNQMMFNFVDEQTNKFSAARSAYAEAESTVTSGFVGVDQ